MKFLKLKSLQFSHFLRDFFSIKFFFLAFITMNSQRTLGMLLFFPSSLTSHCVSIVRKRATRASISSHFCRSSLRVPDVYFSTMFCMLNEVNFQHLLNKIINWNVFEIDFDRKIVCEKIIRGKLARIGRFSF